MTTRNGCAGSIVSGGANGSTTTTSVVIVTEDCRKREDDDDDDDNVGTTQQLDSGCIVKAVAIIDVDPITQTDHRTIDFIVLY
jgi:hypothetical protein